MIPNLLHPVLVEIEQINRTETVQDDDYREPVQQALRGPRKTCPGQVKWGHDQSLRLSAGAGAEEESDGYVLFRYVDLRALGIELGQSDRFVKLGTIEVDLYVVRFRPDAHYADQNGPTLVKAYFKDRFPSKQNRGGK